MVYYPPRTVISKPPQAMNKLRTKLIFDYLKQKNSCSFAELMKHFNISSATIHRYADELSKRDAVTRVRGGLVFNQAEMPRDDTAAYLDRAVTNRGGKIAAARNALTAIDEGDIIFLDSSTTVNELALILRSANFSHLTIVTNSVSIIQDFRKFPSHYVLIGLGGSYDSNLNSILGSEAREQLSHMNITKAFISGFGIDEKNVTTNHERQAELLRYALDAAGKRFLIVDDTKFGRTGLYRIAPVGSFDAIFSPQNRKGKNIPSKARSCNTALGQ